MINAKEIAKAMFPNAIDLWNLKQQKIKNLSLISNILMLNESDYPNYLCSLYKEKTGHELNLDNPQRFTEKIQWRKLFDQNPIYSTLSDKYAVRKWIEKKIGNEYLVPLIGAWEHFKDIDFREMPDQFVLKTNNASHTNIIVSEKRKFMRRKWSAGRRMEYWLNTPFAYLEGLELHYQTIKPMIIAESFLEPDDGESELTDYKFHCFDGTPVLCQIIGNRSSGETIDFYDFDWKHVLLVRPPFPNAKQKKVKPQNYGIMIGIAKELSKGFKYVRVDLYENHGKVYFGEMTFTPGSGMIRFDPDEWDYRLGNLWDIHSSQCDNRIIGK